MCETDESSKMEYKKLQGFDVLEELPPKETMQSYNEEYYSSLSNLRYVSCTIPPEHKLMYKFEQNPNASIKTSIHQLMKTFEDISLMKDELKLILPSVRESFDQLNEAIIQLEENALSFKPELENMYYQLKNFLVNQMGENFILIKELYLMQKEVNDIKEKILEANNTLNAIERKFGSKPRKWSIRTSNDKLNITNGSEMSAKVEIKNYKV